MPFYYYSDSYYLLALLAVMAIGVIAQASVRATYNKYSQMLSLRGLRASDVAQELLRSNGSGVMVTAVKGSLTDHFNPKTETVGLSESVYPSSSVAALAVAAHEIGHVMQYQEGYVPIRIRNAILPVANFGSQAAPFLVIAGMLLGWFDLAIAGVALFAAVLLFQVVTLPVEFNASSRAIAMLSEGGYLAYDEIPGAKKVLRAAAMTYVVAALSSLVSLLRLLAIASRGRRRR